jgi:hypothetical protein
MIARDPVIADVLDRLVPSLNSDPDEMIRRARMAAVPLRAERSRRLRRTVILAFAALLLLGGAALAASQFDAYPWLDRSDRTNATYSIDSSRTYRGPAPDVLVCPAAGAGSFTCSVGSFPSSSHRTYFLVQRVESQPRFSRALILNALSEAERKSQISSADARRVRDDIAAVDDEFFSAMASLTPVVTVGGAEEAPGRPGFDLVPPSGVPTWITCVASDADFRCHDLASSRDVAVGTPFYFLQSSSDWVAVPHQEMRRVDLERFFHAALGRDLKPAEIRLFIDLATLGTTEGGGGSSRPQVGPSRPMPVKP